MSGRHSSALLVLALGLGLASCGGPSTEPRDYDDVAAALEGAELEICAEETPARTIENARGERWFTVSPSCADDPAEDTVLVVVEWPDVSARDHALRRHEAQSRPSGQRHGPTWGAGLLTLHASGTREGDVLDRVADAMDDLGAS